MTTFDLYARYYDLLYRDKDYDGEAEYVAQLIGRFDGGRSVLDLGCGTGLHALALGRRGFNVTGVDLSGEMIKLADQRLHSAALPEQVCIDYHVGDVRTARLGRTYDTVVSLFHVMSYQTSNDDLLAAIDTAARHMAPDGIFIFDAWYGPAVLAQRPTARIKRMDDHDVEVMRVAEPVMHPRRNVVDVNYTVWVTSSAQKQTQRITECHSMRYLFTPEVEFLLDARGMELVHSSEWMHLDKPLDETTWSAVFVAKRRAAK